MRVWLTIVASALAACDTDVKEGFLDDLKDVDAETSDTSATATDGTGGGETTQATDATASETHSDVATADATDPPDVADAADGSDATGPSDTPSDVATDAVVITDVPVADDVVIPIDALEGLGWHASMSPGLAIGPPIAFTGGVAVPVGNGSAVELRAWSADGDGLFAATLFTGVAPTPSGGVACGGMIYVAGHEPDGSKAFIARFETETNVLRVATFFPKTGTTGGSARVLAPRCGGSGAYVQLEPVGDVTYRAHAGGTVQLTAAQTENRSFLVDLVKAFSDIGTLGTVSADKIRMLETAVAEPLTGPPGKEVFYIGEARVPKQLGATTLQPGDQLVYSHDYTDASGGTATNVAFYGDNDLRGLTAASDGRFAVYWRAMLPDGGGEEQRVTAFDAEGQQIGTAVVPIAAPIGRMRWVGAELVLAGTFTGAPPFPGDNHASGTWLAVMQAGVAMTVTRSAAFGQETALVGPLHRVALSGACGTGDAWAVMTARASIPGSLRVVALGDDGGDCASARLGVSLPNVPFGISPIGDGEYAITTSGGLALTLDGSSAWPAGAPQVYVGLVRARAGYAAAP